MLCGMRGAGSGLAFEPPWGDAEGGRLKVSQVLVLEGLPATKSERESES